MDSIPILIAIASPLLASVLTVLFGRLLGERVANISIAALMLSAGTALLSFYQILNSDPLALALPGLPALLTPRYSSIALPES